MTPPARRGRRHRRPLLIPQVISNIALEGTMTPETAAEWLQEQVEATAGRTPVDAVNAIAERQSASNDAVAQF